MALARRNSWIRWDHANLLQESPSQIAIRNSVRGAEREIGIARFAKVKNFQRKSHAFSDRLTRAQRSFQLSICTARSISRELLEPTEKRLRFDLFIIYHLQGFISTMNSHTACYETQIASESHARMRVAPP